MDRITHLRILLERHKVAHFVAAECLKELAATVTDEQLKLMSALGSRSRSECELAALESIASLVFAYFRPHQAKEVLGERAEALIAWEANVVAKILEKHRA